MSQLLTSPRGIYLSPTTGIPYPSDVQKYFGMLMSPRRGHAEILEAGWFWALDNDAFSGQFDPDRWLSYMDNLTKYSNRCLFVNLPDVLRDPVQTFDQFMEWREILVSRFGNLFPFAYVTQDGQDPVSLPWDLIDALFVGGTDRHKLGMGGRRLIDWGIRKKKWIHVGRVNSIVRLNQFSMADSWDGTTLIKEPNGKFPVILRGIKQARSKRKNQLSMGI